MRRLILALLMLVATPMAVRAVDEPTRLLLIVDCSSSMWERWQSESKIKVTQQVLLSFLDSVSAQRDVDVALRVFGHLNQQHYGTKLEVPFGEGNTYRLQSKIKTLVPNGGCTAEAALTDALTDFPATEGARNLILVVTDGKDDRDAEICDVARQVQMSGVVVQTFVIGIGDVFADTAIRHDKGCAGLFFPVADEERMSPTLHEIFRLSGKKARVVVSIKGSDGELAETEHPLSLTDHSTGVNCLNTIYTVRNGIAPDTLMLDPLVAYDMTIFCNPPIVRQAMQFDIDRVNVVDVVVDEGMLRVNYAGERSSLAGKGADVVVSDGRGERVARQAMGVTEAIREGWYDVEVQTLPATLLRGVEVRRGALTELNIAAPGMLMLTKPKGITTGAVFRLDEGRAELVVQLNASVATERLALQPGEYEVVLHARQSTAYNDVQRSRFVIESGQTTKVQL